MKEAVFISYKNGYFKFLFESGEDMVFDDVHPRILKQFDLKNDTSFIGKSFKISFLEVIENSDQDAVIYRIESLKPI
ncbi:hypothetical protein [Yeosuana sp.]|uniref:hypothetical protein n=1 Tax=Yeosuana sp. TaxID=2529388 RepID=UPI004054B0C1|tara:strand:+ start:1916 stop:2146 length:231 start_codon:yes stop_codon:yes gene_type:complete